MSIEFILNNLFIQSTLFALGIIVVYMILRKPILNLFFAILRKVASKTKSKTDDKLVDLIKNPVKMFLTFSVLYIAFKVLALEHVITPETLLVVNNFVHQLYRSIIIITIFVILYNMTGESHVLFDEIFEIFDIRVDKLLVPFVSKIFRLLIFAICIAIVASEWGFDVNGFVAGLGLGGLAFALAAQDTLANTFGGAVIITEKPFTIGDWIIVDGVEGTVEDINFRSTKVRKFNKSIVTVPNSTIAKSNIINYSKRAIRRISFDLKIKKDTPSDKLKTVIQEIENMLIAHEGIHNETIFVKFNKVYDDAYGVFLYYFTNTSVWAEYLSLKEDTTFRIIQILEDNQVELAVPLQEIQLKPQ